MENQSNKVRVWDIVVRACHWLLAIAVLSNLWLTEDGSRIHRYVGYTAVGITLLRLTWGVVGTKYARFSDFFPTPTRIKRHISELRYGQLTPTLGHNPLGALMMLALWGLVLCLGATGYLMGTDQFFGEEWLEELHEILANSLMGLVFLHIAAAIVMSHLERVNLIRAMITGNKDLPPQ